MNTKRAHNVLIGSLLSCMLSIGAYASLAVYVVPISKSIGASIGQVVLLFTFAGVGSLAASLTIGNILKKVSIRTLVSIGGACAIPVFLAIAFSPNIVVIYIAAIFLGMTSIFAGYAAAQIGITWWYESNRGKLISTTFMAVGIFNVIVIPFVTKLITSFGIQKVALFEGLIVGVPIILIGLFLFSEHPDKYSLKPVGYTEKATDYTQVATKSADNNLELKQILRRPEFWLINVAIFLVVGALGGYTNNASPYYQSLGVDAEKAALGISVYSLCRLVWSPIYGALVDKFGPGRATAMLGVVGAVACVLGIILTGFTGVVIIAALIASLNMTGMIGSITLPRVFGEKEAGNMIGYSIGACSIGTMLGTPLAGFIYDSTKSYKAYLIFCIAAIVFSVVIIAYCTSKKTIDKVRASTTKADTL